MKKIFREVADHAIFSYDYYQAEGNVDDERAKELAIEYIVSDDYRAGFPIVVCLCGSTRFSDAFREANLNETLAGRIVLTIGCDLKNDAELFANLPAADLARIKTALDALHMHKVEMADEVLILNVGGYVGESTRRELEYARALGKTIRWLEPEQSDVQTRPPPGCLPCHHQDGPPLHRLSRRQGSQLQPPLV